MRALPPSVLRHLPQSRYSCACLGTLSVLAVVEVLFLEVVIPTPRALLPHGLEEGVMLFAGYVFVLVGLQPGEVGLTRSGCLEVLQGEEIEDVEEIGGGHSHKVRARP